MKKIFPLMLAVLWLAAGCGSGCTKKMKPQSPTLPNIVETEDSSGIAPQPSDASQVVISMQTTSCYGTCPVFKFEVLADGTAYFEGIRHVERLGKYQSLASKIWQQQVLERGKSLGFFQMEQRYPRDGKKVADFPMTITFLKSGGQAQKIENNFDAPLNLQQFEQFLLEKIEDLEWVKR